MDKITRYFDKLAGSNGAEQWLLAAGTTVALLLITTLVRRFATRQYNKLAQTETVELMEWPMLVISRTATLFLVVASAVIGLLTLDMPDRLRSILEKALTIALFWQAGIWISTFAIYWINERRRASMTENRAAVGTLSIIALIVRVIIWSIVLLLTLDNLGVDVTALIAGLGVGGIAVALAVQNILGDLLASLSIALDKPFVVGDFLIIGDYLGAVEHIGIKSTRLRSLTGEQIVMSNADLLSSRVRNYGRMVERRIVFGVGVTYETPRAQVEKIPGLIREIVAAQQNVRFDRCHFAKFGAASLDYEIVYYVLSPDYNLYMDIQQAINFKVLEAFEREGIEFAYPTQKLWLANVASAAGEKSAGSS